MNARQPTPTAEPIPKSRRAPPPSRRRRPKGPLHRRALLGGLLAAAAACWSPSPARASEKPAVVEKQRYRVAAIGDSLTDYRSNGGGYLRLLEKKCPESGFDNYGRGGKMVNQMRRKFRSDVFGEGQPKVDKPKYTHVIVFGGVNDLYSDLTAGRTPDKIARDLTKMYEWARADDIRIVAVTVAPWGGFRKYYNERRGKATTKLNAWIGRQLEDGKVDYLVDAYRLLSCGDPERLCPEYAAPYPDGLHFGPKGHEKLGLALYESIFKDCR